MFSEKGGRERDETYFIKKIHLHVVRSEITPPNNGPSKFAIANTELMTPE